VTRNLAILTLSVALAAGCGSDDSSSGATLGASATTTTDTAAGNATSPTQPGRGTLPERSPTSTLPSIVDDSVPVELINELQHDAGTRTGVDASAIVVVQARVVSWPDGSLGCPEPGVVYTQAIVPGYWVVLEAAGEQLDYRVGSRDSFVICENPASVPPPGVAPTS
jgi:hypothetical protein